MKKLTRQVATLASNGQHGSTLKVTLILSLLSLTSVLLAADTELPEMEFLEYLGLWEESDEDWILLSEDVGNQVAAEDTRTDPVPKGEESAETNDES